uniref:DNA-binding HORMA family protein 2 n=1 Tax=Emiliania huxleyi TaxID=2903 RepID=A0A2H4MD04_EMIHU|nr:DNA-binding HORMA family protein 2 [Emiliania huxleyi]
MASGQAQEQRVNLENSIKLQRNMMKMVFGELAYQRQLFPEDCFELKEMGGNHIHTLSAESDNVYHEQVSRMISWYSDDSILDALRNGYLEKVMFVLAHDQACEHPIEVWDLSYTYESDDTVSSRFTRRSGGGGAPASESIEVARSRPKDKVTKDYIRDVVKVVLRRLSLLLQGLDDVPQERWCGMRLLYRDDVTPSDYEPSGFSPAPATVAGAGSFFFERPATFFMVGKVSTGHHALSLGVALPEMPGIEPTAHDEACTTRDGSGYRFDLVQAADGPPDDEDELRGGVGLRGGRRGNGEDLERLTQEAPRAAQEAAHRASEAAAWRPAAGHSLEQAAAQGLDVRAHRSGAPLSACHPWRQGRAACPAGADCPR